MREKSGNLIRPICNFARAKVQITSADREERTHLERRMFNSRCAVVVIMR